MFGPNESQSQVYDTAVSRMVEWLFDGENVSILSYGQTGSGKTYTMGFGGCAQNVFSEESGIAPRIVTAIFRKMHEDGPI